MTLPGGSKDWWRGSVTYQIYPRSFQDSTGDGFGDLRGIIRRLPHVADLGVDAIWLSPIFTSPMRDMGYDVADYRGIDPSFGTLADFDALVAEAHRLGLRVIVDQVLSHSSDRHPAFLESRASREGPKADWYVWADPGHDGAPPNNWQSVFGGIAWAWEPRRRQYYLHNFLASQPDFNFHHPEVQDFHLGNMRFWLDRGVDGFRLDTVNFYFHDRLLRSEPAHPNPHPDELWHPYGMQLHLFSKNQPENLAFLGRIRSLLGEYEGRATVGEVGDATRPVEIMGEYTSDGRLHMAYSFEMLGWTFTARHFREQIERFHRLAPGGWPCWAFSNHDVVRHLTRWAEFGAGEEALARMCATMLLSFEGSVCLYQGEEAGQTETDLSFEEVIDPQGLAFWPDNKGRDGCRTPMAWEAGAANAGFTSGTPWLPVKAPQAERAVDARGALVEHYRRMVRLRRAEEALRTGTTRFLDVPEPVLAFVRGETLLCAFNLSSGRVRLETPPLGEILAASGASAEDGCVDLDGSGAIVARLREGG